MGQKERIIVILLVIALIFSFVSLTLHFVGNSSGFKNYNGTNGESGQVNLVVQHNSAGETATSAGTG